MMASMSWLSKRDIWKEEEKNPSRKVIITDSPFVVGSKIIVPHYTEMDIVYWNRQFYEYDPNNHSFGILNNIISSDIYGSACIYNSKIHSILSIGGAAKEPSKITKAMIKNQELKDVFDEIDQKQDSIQSEIILYNIGKNECNKFLIKENKISGCKCLMIDNYIHIISNNAHSIYMYKPKASETFVLLQVIDDPFVCNECIRKFAFLYHKKKNNLIVFGGSYTSISSVGIIGYYRNFCQYNISNNKWSIVPQKSIPIDMTGFGYILYSDRFIVTFSGVSGGSFDVNNDEMLDALIADNAYEDAEEYKQYMIMTSGQKNDLDDIWILDLEKDDISWIKSSKKCPIKGMCFAVLQNKTVHVFERRNGGYCRINIEHLIPSYFNLVCEQNTNLQHKVTTLKKLNTNLIQRQSKITQQFQNSQNKMEILKKENINLKRDLEQIQCAKKAMKSEIIMLRERIKNINNCRNYMNWSTQNVLEWILGLEQGKYQKYCKKLKHELFEKEICGRDLQHITQQHLQQFGIKAFGDQISLLKQLKNMTQRQNHLQYVEGLEFTVEGK